MTDVALRSTRLNRGIRIVQPPCKHDLLPPTWLHGLPSRGAGKAVGEGWVEPNCRKVTIVPSDRYFSSTAMAGRLHFNDIGDHAWWDPSRILFTNERDLDAILPRMVAVKIHTVDELDKALMASENHPGSKSLYVYETLLETAKRRWEELRNQLSFT